VRACGVAPDGFDVAGNVFYYCLELTRVDLYN
jgi:hypothetical protein